MLGDRVFAALRRAFLVCVNENSFGISFLRTDPPFTQGLADRTEESCGEA